MLAKMAGGRDEAVKRLLVAHHYIVRAVVMSAASVTKRSAEAHAAAHAAKLASIAGKTSSF
jgi:hypothetical protein